jgi:multiple sugar transport system permease protein
MTRRPLDALPWLLPALAVIAAIVVVPLLATVGLSFTDAVRGAPGRLAGLAQYARLAHDPAFGRALLFTLLFAICTVATEMALGLGVAALLAQRFAGRGLARVLLLLPWAVPTVVAGRVWQWMFDYRSGLLNTLAAALGGPGARIDWLGSLPAAYLSLGLADVWKTTPYVIILALAALLALDPDVVSAARLDGARAWLLVRRVALPLIAPALLIIAAFRLVDAFRVFDLVYVLTGGGPGGSTTSVSLYAYQQLFVTGEQAYSAAIAVASFGALLLLALPYLAWYRRARAFRGGAL